MNTQQQLNNSLEFIKKTSSDELVNKHLKLVFDIYYKVFGEVCTGCPSKIAGYISRLKNYNKTSVMEKDTREFRLKKLAIIPVPGTSIAYSDANITDEIALKILKENPNRRSIFLKVPENLEELLSQEDDQNGNADVVKIGGADFTLKQALEILKNNDISTKATTIKGVQNKVDKVEKEGVEINTEDVKDLPVDDVETEENKVNKVETEGVE